MAKKKKREKKEPTFKIPKPKIERTFMGTEEFDFFGKKPAVHRTDLYDREKEKASREKLGDFMGTVRDEKLKKREELRKNIKKRLDRPLAPKKGRRLTRLGKPFRASTQKGIKGFFR